jgi:hypothetical protein
MVSGSTIGKIVGGVVFVTFVGIVGAEAQTVDTTKASQPVVAKVGTYPNKSGWGVTGNPALTKEFGEYWTVGYGKSNGNETVSLGLNKKVGDSFALISVGSTTGKQNNSSVGVGISTPVCDWVSVGGSVTKVTSTDGKTKSSSSLGAVGVFNGKNLLIRTGVMEDFADKSMHYAAEARMKTMANADATLSGKLVFKDGKMQFSGVGAQLKKGKVIGSVGQNLKDGSSTAALRILLDKKGKKKIDFEVPKWKKGMTKPPFKVGFAGNF